MMYFKNKYLRNTKAFVRSSLLVAMLILTFGCETDESQSTVSLTKLVVADEFDVEGAPDPTLWAYDIGRGPGGDGWGNQELQYYTDRADNVKVVNGYLLITAQEESFEGASYTSARLLTKGLFEQRYGRFEARIRMPWGQGIWPAFWMLGADIDTNPWPGAGEIDIMEFRGQEPNLILGSVHGPGYSAGESIGKSYTLENDRFDSGFHVFGIEWGPNYINYYVDGDLYNQITPDDVPGEWVFDKPFYILINLAVGGTFVGSPDADTVFPQTMVVDYVRVYE